MSKIEEMLKGVKVEWKKLGEVAELRRGRVMSKEYLIENKGLYPVFSSQTANNGMIGSINTYDFDGEYVNWTTDGANAGTVFYRTGKFSITNVSGLIKIIDNELLMYKFLYYWLSIEAKKYVYSGMGNPKLMSNQVEKILIPIPPLEVQKEIVRILDTFTTLTAELQAELQARKLQYEYYREELLNYSMEEFNRLSLHKSRSASSIQNDNNFSKQSSELNSQTNNSDLQPHNKVVWKTLGEVTHILRGKRVVKSQLEETGKYAVYQNSMTPLGYFENFNVKRDTTFIISAGAAGEIGYSNIDFWAADDVYYFEPYIEIVNKFIYYYLQTKQTLISGRVRRASVPRLSKTAFERILIPIPPLYEQERIVSILDKFDTLTTSLTEGLPREIELRQKQYEYYREKLLTFPSSES